MLKVTVLAALAEELDLLPEDAVARMVAGYLTGGGDASFDDWATQSGLLTVPQVEGLNRAWDASTFACVNCGKQSRGRDLKEDGRLASCPACGSSALKPSKMRARSDTRVIVRKRTTRRMKRAEDPSSHPGDEDSAAGTQTGAQIVSDEGNPTIASHRPSTGRVRTDDPESSRAGTTVLFDNNPDGRSPASAVVRGADRESSSGADGGSSFGARLDLKHGSDDFIPIDDMQRDATIRLLSEAARRAFEDDSGSADAGAGDADKGEETGNIHDAVTKPVPTAGTKRRDKAVGAPPPHPATSKLPGTAPLKTGSPGGIAPGRPTERLGGAFELGGTIGNWQIRRLAGHGGMGAVFQAYNPHLDQYAAIKVLDVDAKKEHDVGARFRSEARTLGKLDHPNIVQVKDFGEYHGRPYIVMQWVDGESLDQWVQREGSIPIEDAVELAMQSADGLQAAHDEGIVHRDIKPENLMLETRRRILKIADFGLAQWVRSDARMTPSGTFIGTPAYMSPEHIDGQKASPASDIYSLAATVYHLITGMPPFGRGAYGVILHRHMTQPFPSLRDRRPHAPAALDDLLQHMCAKLPKDRPPGAMAVKRRLEDILADIRADKTGRARPGRANVPSLGNDGSSSPEADATASMIAAEAALPNVPPSASVMVMQAGDEEAVVFTLRRMLREHRLDKMESPAEFALRELIENARRHAFEGGEHPQILVELSLTTDRLTLSVHDDGNGFDFQREMRRIEEEAMAESAKIARASGLVRIRRLINRLRYDDGGRKAIVEIKTGADGQNMRGTLNFRTIDRDKKPIDVVTIVGPFTSRTAGRLKSNLTTRIRRGVRIFVLDLESCSVVDSTGLGILVNMQDALEEVSGSLVLVSVHEKVMQVFEMLGLHDYFRLADSVDEAISVSEPAS